ncbi:hypothetical protein J3F83DRAFT_588627 [Trichoderma novae-zelandiae]
MQVLGTRRWPDTSCLALAKLSKTDNMEMLLRRPETQVGRNLVRTVFLYDVDGEMTRLLLRCRGSKVEINEESLTVAASNDIAAKQVMAAILQHRRSSITITTEVLRTAARNTSCGEKVLKVLSPYIDSTNVTYVAEAAAQNTDHGHKVMELLFRVHSAIDDDATRGPEVPIARSPRVFRKGSVGEFKITQQLLDVAVRSEACGAHIFAVLFEHRPDNIKLTNHLVRQAMYNKLNGLQILKVFLEYRPGSLEVMETMAKHSDESHAPHGKVALRMFLEHLASQGPAASREFAVFMRWCTSESARQYLRFRGRGLAITKEVIQALALNDSSRNIIIPMLLRQTRPILHLKRDAVWELVATFGSLALDWLLRYRPKEYTDRESIQSEVLDGLMTAKERRIWNLFPFAAGQGHQALVKLLLERRANIEEKLDRRNIGPTAVNLAAASGHKDMVALLFGRGANIEARDLDGRTPLLLAAEKHEGIAELLVLGSANVDAMDCDGRRPLMAASRSGFGVVVLGLLDRGYSDRLLEGFTMGIQDEGSRDESV